MNAVLLRVAAWVAAGLPAGIRQRLYRLGPLTAAIRQGLNRAAPAGPQVVSVAAGPLRGAHFTLDLRREKDLWLGNYELELMEMLSRVLTVGMTVYDVGANLGYVTVAIARLVGPNGSVHAFEPLPENLARMRDAVGRNGLEGQVRIVAAAVGSQPGTERFLKHEFGGMGKLASASGRRGSYPGELEVAVLSLDSYVFERGEAVPAWIKVDVEGGEAGVMVGARQLLREERPGLLLEIHGPEAAEGVWRELEDAGYALQTLDGRSVDAVAALDWKAYLLATPVEATAPGTGDG